MHYHQSIVPDCILKFAELEVDVNALRRGELVQGKDINRRSENGLEKIPRVNPLPPPESSKDGVTNDVSGMPTPTTDYF